MNFFEAPMLIYFQADLYFSLYLKIGKDWYVFIGSPKYSNIEEPSRYQLKNLGWCVKLKDMVTPLYFVTDCLNVKTDTVFQ